MRIQMKKTTLLLTFLTLSIYVFAQPQVSNPGVQGSIRTEYDDPNDQDLRFESIQHNFGNIPAGIAAKHEFHFINLGIDPLSIEKVETSCGCAAPSWPEIPVDPGNGSAVIISYNAATMGSFTKTARVYWSGSDNPIRLVIKGKVVPHAEADDPHDARRKADEIGKPTIKSNSEVRVAPPKRTMTPEEVNRIFAERQKLLDQRKEEIKSGKSNSSSSSIPSPTEVVKEPKKEQPKRVISIFETGVFN